jgi:hypothetical protein
MGLIRRHFGPFGNFDFDYYYRQSYHVEFIIFADQRGEGKGRHATGGQRVIRVDDGPVLGVAFGQS